MTKYQDLQYIKHGHVDDLAMMLSADVYSMEADMDYFAVRERLMKAIVERFEDFIQMSVEEHAHKPALTLWQVACLVLSVWKHMDYQHNITSEKLVLAEQTIASARPNHTR